MRGFTPTAPKPWTPLTIRRPSLYRQPAYNLMLLQKLSSQPTAQFFQVFLNYSRALIQHSINKPIGHHWGEGDRCAELEFSNWASLKILQLTGRLFANRCRWLTASELIQQINLEAHRLMASLRPLHNSFSPLDSDQVVPLWLLYRKVGVTLSPRDIQPSEQIYFHRLLTVASKTSVFLNGPEQNFIFHQSINVEHDWTRTIAAWLLTPVR